jgi:hypothetical protein
MFVILLTEERRGDMQGEKPSGVSRSNEREGVRGFKSHPRRFRRALHRLRRWGRFHRSLRIARAAASPHSCIKQPNQTVLYSIGEASTILPVVHLPFKIPHPKPIKLKILNSLETLVPYQTPKRRYSSPKSRHHPYTTLHRQSRPAHSHSLLHTPATGTVRNRLLPLRHRRAIRLLIQHGFLTELTKADITTSLSTLANLRDIHFVARTEVYNSNPTLFTKHALSIATLGSMDFDLRRT